jgi:antitoxin component YwqK of YwqJK toxin-antitoxin module
VVSEQPFKDNKIHGTQKGYYDDGKLRQTVEFANARRNGMTTLYYETGQKHSETPYKDGKEDGIKRIYRKDGELAQETPYSNGIPVPPLKEYDDKSNLIVQPKIVFSGSTVKLDNNSFILSQLYKAEGDTLIEIEGAVAKGKGTLKGVKKGDIVRAVYKTPRGAEGAVDGKY